MEAEDEKHMEELSFVPGAVSWPRWALHMCDHKCTAKSLSSSTLRLVCQKEEAQRKRLTFAGSATQHAKQGEAEVTGSTWRALIEKTSRGKLWAAFGVEQFLRRMWERCTINKAWARSILEDAEHVKRLGTGGNAKRRARRSSSLCGTALTCASMVC